MLTVLTHIQIVNVFLCLILALHFLSASARRPLSLRLLGGNYLLFALQSLLLIMVLNNSWVMANYLRPCFAMMIAPLYYLYAQSVFRNQTTVLWRDYAHILPMFVVALFFITDTHLIKYLDGYIVMSYCWYLALVLIKLIKGVGQLSHLGEYALPAFRWLSALSLLAVINIFFEISVYFELENNSALVNSYALLIGTMLYALVNMMTLLVALRRTEFVEWIYDVGGGTLHKVNTESVSDNEIRALFEQWKIVVAQKKLHLREFGITLSEAAKIMSVPSRQLSTAVNKIYGASFSQYLNDLRVEEVKRLFKEQPEATLTQLMFDAGFSTKSSFNKEFSRVEGVSPSAYRKR